MTLNILEVCKVTPPLGSPTDICIPLAFFDLIWLRFPPAELLFFYETPFNSKTLVTRLKNSLSLTLCNFLPLSGNLEWPSCAHNPIIHYKEGDGVLFTVTDSGADFIHLSTNRFRESEIFRPLVAEITGSDSQVPILAIKVSLFSNKGFCIGITHHHAALDAAVVSMFYNSWAYISKFRESPKSIPDFDRNSVRERYTHLENLYINHYLKQDVVNLRSLAVIKVESITGKVRGTFPISASDIKSLKDFILKHAEVNHDVSLTTFTVILAYIIVCLVKAKMRIENKVGFDIVVDCREKLEPPLSPNYAGNCIGFAGGYVESEHIVGDYAIIAAVKAVQKMRKDIEDGVLRGVETWLEEFDVRKSGEIKKRYECKPHTHFDNGVHPTMATYPGRYTLHLYIL